MNANTTLSCPFLSVTLSDSACNYLENKSVFVSLGKKIKEDFHL